MPSTAVHFNGGVNLADAETVMREIAARVPRGVTRIPDGETGDRQQWIFFQLQKFWQRSWNRPAPGTWCPVTRACRRFSWPMARPPIRCSGRTSATPMPISIPGLLDIHREILETYA